VHMILRVPFAGVQGRAAAAADRRPGIEVAGGLTSCPKHPS
jgi:hypothetical protein